MTVSLRHRLPYITVMSLAAGLLTLHAVDAWLARAWPDLTASALLVAALLAATIRFGTWRPALPRTAGRYEIVASTHGGCYVRCNRCDTIVLPFARTLTLPRMWTYTHLHTIAACEPRRRTDPENTRRLLPCRIPRPRKPTP